MKTISDYDVLHKVMWDTYELAKEDNFNMSGLTTKEGLEILEGFLLPYFIKYEHFEVCSELQYQIKEKQNI